MIKIALIKDDGTWEEKKLRITRVRFSDSVFKVLSHLRDIGIIVDGEYPEGVVEVAILPDNWNKKKKMRE
jgi:hypothetical protein